MGLKRLGNTGEHKSFRILDRALRDIGFTVNRQSKVDDLASHFCDFFALDKLRLWAEQNLREISS
jgi:hypothetical protein